MGKILSQIWVALISTVFKVAIHTGAILLVLPNFVFRNINLCLGIMFGSVCAMAYSQSVTPIQIWGTLLAMAFIAVIGSAVEIYRKR